MQAHVVKESDLALIDSSPQMKQKTKNEKKMRDKKEEEEEEEEAQLREYSI